MPTLRLRINPRKTNEFGERTILLTIYANGHSRDIPTKISIAEEYWDKAMCRVSSKHPKSRLYNLHLRDLYDKCELVLLNTNNRISVDQLRNNMVDAINGVRPADRTCFCDFGMEYMQSRREGRTRESYAYTINKVKEYAGEEFKLSQITKMWLEGFESWISKTAKHNTAVHHLVNIRAIYKAAIDEDLVVKDPFRRFRIRKEKTRKRNLKIDQLRTLLNYPCEEWQKQYQDIFKLMFCLCGINGVDLFSPDTKIVNGRLEYQRSKTGALFSFKIEPEIADILERYKGKNHLLMQADKYKNHRDFFHRMNEGLQKIGPFHRKKGRGGEIVYEPLFPDVTTYWARHSWATIAFSIGIPKDTISMALGHSFGLSRVTDIYIEYDKERIIDEANRKVLDYVFGEQEQNVC